MNSKSLLNLYFLEVSHLKSTQLSNNYNQCTSFGIRATMITNQSPLTSTCSTTNEGRMVALEVSNPTIRRQLETQQE